MKPAKAPFRATYFPPSEMRVERRADGTLVVEPVTELAPFIPNLPAQLSEWPIGHSRHRREVKGKSIISEPREHAGNYMRRSRFVHHGSSVVHLEHAVAQDARA